MKYSIHQRGQTARQMNTQQYIDWDQRRIRMTQSADSIDAHTMSERQYWASEGISVSRQVSERIEDILDGWLSYGDNAAAVY